MFAVEEEIAQAMIVVSVILVTLVPNVSKLCAMAKQALHLMFAPVQAHVPRLIPVFANRVIQETNAQSHLAMEQVLPILRYAHQEVYAYNLKIVNAKQATLEIAILQCATDLTLRIRKFAPQKEYALLQINVHASQDIKEQGVKRLHALAIPKPLLVLVMAKAVVLHPICASAMMVGLDNSVTFLFASILLPTIPWFAMPRVFVLRQACVNVTRQTLPVFGTGYPTVPCVREITLVQTVV